MTSEQRVNDKCLRKRLGLKRWKQVLAYDRVQKALKPLVTAAYAGNGDVASLACHLLENLSREAREHSFFGQMRINRLDRTKKTGTDVVEVNSIIEGGSHVETSR